jgi:uncharacterized RDD family membrane protein YckC
LTAEEQQRPEAPSETAPLPPETASLLPPGLAFADTPSRIAAYVLDGVLLSALVSIPPAVLGLYDYASTSSTLPEPMPRATFVGVSIFSFAIYAAYFLFFWSGGRRGTPGQRAFGIQVGNAFDGRPLTTTQAIERWLAMGWWVGMLVLVPVFSIAVAAYALSFIWSVVLVITMILSPTKQGIHDRFARSALVRPAGESNRWAVGCVWLLIIVAVVEIVLLVALFSIIGTFDDAGVFPPGMHPFDIFTDQIRELWPY